MSDKKMAEPEWARFGLREKPGSDQGSNYPISGSDPRDLFTEEQGKDSMGDRPWWKANFFLKEPVLFGTWDGVFTSVMINIFGVIVFLKTGWMVVIAQTCWTLEVTDTLEMPENDGNAGVNQAVGVLVLCTVLALLPVLSAVGICERCQIQSGGVYFLVSHILGGQIGGAVGVLYAFGQAVATSLVAVGFGESMAHLFGTDNDWLIRLFALVILLLLVAINVAGVTWVIKLQLFLLALLLLAAADLTLGSFITTESDIENGVVGYSSANWHNNTGPGYDKQTNQNFFSVFGVYFATFTGVLAGVNMSGDLKNPSRNIPLGELAALAAGFFLCLLFILILGGVCERTHLLTDVMIAERVSATKVLFLCGLYVSSCSSILGGVYAAPRVLQSIAAENVIPAVKVLEVGRGANRVPVWATLVLTGVSALLVIIRSMETLALMATMPFLITYSFVNYAYVSLAMTYDLQQAKQARVDESHVASAAASYGSMDHLKAAAQAEKGGSPGDLDHLFPERQQKPGGPLTATNTDPPPSGPDAGPTLLEKEQKPSIIHQPTSWYSCLCNRWLSLIGAVVNVMIIFLAHLGFAFANLILLGLLYFYIGHSSPGVFPGISEFSIPHSVRTVLSKWTGADDGEIVVTAPLHPGVETFASKLTEDNADYAQRHPYHQSRTEHMDDFD